MPTSSGELIVQIVAGIFGGGGLLKLLDWLTGSLAARAQERRASANDTIERLRKEILDLEQDRDTCRADAERARRGKEDADRWAARLEAMLLRGGLQPPERPEPRTG
jgi:hypothetical protein